MKRTIWLLPLAVLFLPPLLLGQEEEKSCTSIGCHVSLIDQRYVHPPAEDDCGSCHESNGNPHPQSEGPEFELLDEPVALCTACHEEKNTKKVVHPPVEDGECVSCHNPHGSPYKFFLSYSSIDSVCAECHDLEIAEKAFQHGPVEAGECTSCHNPHESDAPSLLVEEKPALCFMCHSDMEEQLQLSTVHAPVDEDCQNCHEPHAADLEKLLTDKIPELCYTCHDDVQETAENSPVSHSPVTTDRTCLNCHLPHASKEESLLNNQPKALCLGCHNKKIKLDGEVLANIAQKLKLANYIHEPVESDVCTACHKPHGATYGFLLDAKFPSGNYAPGKEENYELCFNCHDPEMILEPNVSEDVTNFRNGSTNLHYLHVASQKGRTCINCHDVHASELPHLVPVHVRFGRWDMPLKYKPTENGGSCTPGCHKEYSYQR